VKTKDPWTLIEIKSAVNAALAAKGWTQVDSGGDASIVGHADHAEPADPDTFYDRFGGGWGWRRFGGGGFGEATTTTETYKVGTWSSICSTARPRNSYGEAPQATRSPITPIKNIKNMDKALRSCLSHSLQFFEEVTANMTHHLYAVVTLGLVSAAIPLRAAN